MPYIGRELERGTYLKLDDISSSFDGNKTIFNLTKGGDPFFPGSPQSIIVSVNGTILEPVTQYGIDSSKIVFGTAPTAGHSFFSITLGLPFGVFDNGSIEDGSLTGVKLSNPFNYDDGLLFLNSLTDRVGIRTANPTHDLDIHGDVRVVGILTVGTSSLVLDGSNNKIQVGTALTLSHSDGAIIGNSHLHSTGYDLKDDARIRFGNDNDLRIYHSTSGSAHNRVESGNKELRILSSNQIQLNTGAEHMLIATANGSVDLYHGMDGSSAQKKFNTTTTGATVTGKLVVTGDLTVNGTTTTLDTVLTEVDRIEVDADSDTIVGVAITQSGTGDALTIDDGTSRVFTVADGGKVGIGTNNPRANKLHLFQGSSGFNYGTTGHLIVENSSDSKVQMLVPNTAASTILFGDEDNGMVGRIKYNHPDNKLSFWTGNTRRMTIFGNSVGIGTSVPKMQLHAYKATPSDTGGILVSNVSYDSNQDKPYLIVGTKSWTGANTNWNTFGFQHKIKVNSGGVPRLTIDSCLSDGTIQELFSFKTGSNSGLGIGVTEPTGKLHLPDSGELRLGNDGDLKILHTGSLGVIGNVTGDLYIQANQDGDVGGNIYIRAKAGEHSIFCEDDGPVFLYNDGAPKFRTYSEGIQVLSSEGGNAAILINADESDDNNDSYRIIAGDGTNLNFQNYATGSYVTNLRLTGDGNSAVELYYAGTKRLDTTDTGVSITDNLNVAGVTTSATIKIKSTLPFLQFFDADAAADNQKWNFFCNASQKFVIQATNDAGGGGGNLFLFTRSGNQVSTFEAQKSGVTWLTVDNPNRKLTTRDLDVTNNLDVNGHFVGISTFSDDIHLDSGKILVLNSNGSNPVIKIQGGGPNIIRFASDAGGTVDAASIDLAYRTTPNTIAFRRSSDAAEFLTVDADDGLVLVSNNLNVTGNLDVNTLTTLRDDVTISADNKTFKIKTAGSVDKFVVDTNNGNTDIQGTLDVGGDLTVGDGSADSRLLIKKSDNNVSDHLQFYYQNTRIGEIGVEDTDWLRINQETNKNIYTPRYIRADAGFFVDGTAKGINGSGNFIGGTIAGASDYDTLLRSDTDDTINGELNVGGSSVSANEGGQIKLTLAPNSTLNGSVIIDQYIDQLRFFEGSGSSARGATIIFTRLSGSTDNEIFSSGLTGVGFTVTNLRSFGIPNGVVAISTSTQAHIPLTVTNSGGESTSTIIAKFVGDSDSLQIRNISDGDYQIRNSQQNNGIGIFDGTGGVALYYNDSRKMSAINTGVSLNDELTFENDDEGVTTFGGGRFYKQNGGGIAIRQSSGNQTPVIESNNGTLQGTILHTASAVEVTGNMKFTGDGLQMSDHYYQGYYDVANRRNYIHLYPAASADRGTSASQTDIRAWTGTTFKTLVIKGDADPTWDDNNIIHAGNANTELTQFLRSDISDTVEGRITFNNSNAYPIIIDNTNNAKMVLAGSSNPYIRFREGSTDRAYIQFHSTNGFLLANEESGESLRIQSGSDGLKFVHDGTTSTVLHTGNINTIDLPSGITIAGANPTLNLTDTDTDADDFFIHVNSNKFYVLTDLDDDGASADDTSHHYPLVLDNANKKISSYGSPVLNEHQGFNPYDVIHAYNNSNPDTIRFNFTEMAMELSPPYGGTDTSMGLAFPAFRVNTNTGETFKLSVQIRSAASTTNGVYIRVYEYDAELPDGKTHISNDASSNAVVQEDTRQKTISPTFENQAGDTDWRTKTFTYTPTSTAVWASVVVLNWSGHGTNSLYVRDLKRERDLSSATTGIASQITLGNDSGGSTPRRLVFASADIGTATLQADTSSGATYTPSTGTITAQNFSGSGSAISNVNAAKVVVSDESSDTTCHPLFATTNTGNAEVKVGSNLSFNSSTGALTATSFVGTRTGNQITDTGNRSTTGYVEMGRGGGGIALTINDGYGNANICFNHKSGVPEQNGASGRIEVNTDSTTANNAFMKLQLASAVGAGVTVNPTDVLNIMSNATAAPFRLGLMTTNPEATFHIESNHNASDVPTLKLSEFRPSIHFEDVSTSATDWEILCDHNDISNSLQFRSGDSSSQNKLTNLEYYMDYTGFHIGNSDGNRQRKLILHAGTAASDTATLYCSNGNLHIDAETHHNLYLNHYEGNEVRLNYGGNGDSGLKLRTLSGGVEITGQLTNNGDIQLTNANPEIELNSGGPRLRVPSANTLTFHSGAGLGSANEERMRIGSDGIITMYNDLLVNAPSTDNYTRLHGGSMELNRTANDAFIDFKTTFNEDYDCRIQKSGNALMFYTGGNNSSDLGLQINGSQIVEIPNNKLLVKSSIDFYGELNYVGASAAATKYMDIGFQGGSLAFLMRRINYNDSGHTTFFTCNQSLVMSGDFNDTSDVKLKKNVATISDGAIEDIKKLRPVIFDWIDDTRNNNVSGFVAQEVKEVLPNLIDGTEYDPTLNDPEKGTKGGIKSEGYSINSIGVTAHLTKALQEAIAKIETLEAEVTALKAKVG